MAVGHPGLPRLPEIVEGDVLQPLVPILQDAAPAGDDGDVVQDAGPLIAEVGRLRRHDVIEQVALAVQHHQGDGGVLDLGRDDQQVALAGRRARFQGRQQLLGALEVVVGHQDARLQQPDRSSRHS